MNNFDKIPEYSTRLFTEIYDNAEDFKTDYKGIGIPETISEQSATTLFYLLYAKYANNPIANYDVEQWKYKLFSTVFMYGPTWEKRLDIQKKLREMSEEEIMQGIKIKLDSTHSASGTSTKNSTNNSTTTVDQTTSGSNNSSTKTDQDTTGTSSNTTVTDQTTSGTNSSTTTTDQDTTGSSTQNNTKSGTNIANHAFNPATAPVTSATTPLTYIDQQNYTTTSETDTATTTTSGTNNSTVTVSGSDSTENKSTVTVNGTTSGTNDSTVTSTGTTSGKNDSTTTVAGTLADNGNTSESSEDISTNAHTLGKLEAYAQLWDLLDNDVTNDFLVKFLPCFKKFVRPAHTYIYVTEEEN